MPQKKAERGERTYYPHRISRVLQRCTCGVSSLAYTLGGDVQRCTRAEMARRLEVYGRMVCKGADEDPFDPEDLAPEAVDDGL